MKIDLIHQPFPETRFRQSHARSGGVHLSRIIQDMEETLYPDRFKSTACWDLSAAAQAGVFWETVLEQAYGDMFALDVGEITLDNIVMTPDGVNFDDEGAYVEEYKLTWKSSSQDPIGVFKYRMQGLGYCKGLGLTRILYRILHLMGDYKGSGPQYRVWMVEWEQAEIYEAWESIVNHAKYRGWI